MQTQIYFYYSYFLFISSCWLYTLNIYNKRNKNLISMNVYIKTASSTEAKMVVVMLGSFAQSKIENTSLSLDERKSYDERIAWKMVYAYTLIGVSNIVVIHASNQAQIDELNSCLIELTDYRIVQITALIKRWLPITKESSHAMKIV